VSFIYVTDGQDDILAVQLNQILDALSGTAGKGQPISMTALNDAINFALTVRNLDANGRAVQVLSPTGVPLLQVDASGVKLSWDGGAATIPVVTGGTQTLSNKTLTSPVINGTLTGSAGFDPWTSWTPAFTQGGTNPTLNNLSSAYSQEGKYVRVRVNVQATSTGVAGSPIIVSTLPVPPKFTSGYSIIGTFTYLQLGVDQHVGAVVATASALAQMFGNKSTGGGYLGATGGPSFAVAVGDTLSMKLEYEAA